MVQAHDFQAPPCRPQAHACFADASLKHKKDEAKKRHDAQKPKDFDKKHAQKHGKKFDKKHGKKHAWKRGAKHGRQFAARRPMMNTRPAFRQPNAAAKVVNIYL